MKENKEFSPWTLITKIAPIFTIGWIIFQAYQFYIKSNSIDVEVNANYFKYELQPDGVINYSNFKKLKDIVRQDKFKSSYGLFNSENQEISKLLGGYEKIPFVETQNPNTFWNFSIKNTGEVPIEELSLEMPVSGAFRYASTDGKSKTDNFKNRIEFGKINPTHSISINVWTTEFDNSKDGYNIISLQEKIRFTHKLGAIEVMFPLEISGFWKWIYENIFVLTFIFIITFLMILFYTYSFGKEYGPQIEEEQMKDKIKELEKLNEWQKKLSTKSGISDEKKED